MEEHKNWRIGTKVKNRTAQEPKIGTKAKRIFQNIIKKVKSIQKSKDKINWVNQRVGTEEKTNQRAGMEEKGWKYP